MRAKEYLGQIRRLDHKINSDLAEIYRYRTLAMSITIEPKGDKIKSSGGKDRMAEAVVKIVDLERQINTEVEELIQARQEIVEKINAIENNDYRDVLTERYVLCKAFDNIYENINMSRRKMYYTHKMALEFFENYYRDDLKDL